MLRFLCVGALLSLTMTNDAFAQEKKPKPPEKLTRGDEMILKHLHAEADRLSERFLDGAASLEEWRKKRPRLYQQYMDMLGLWPLPEKTPLKATVTRTFENQGAVIENLHFQSKPGLYVTCNLYRPARTSGDKKLPAIVYVCGHSNKGRDGSKSAYQDHGLWFANNGYVCIVLDTLQLGEIPGVHHGTYGRPWLHLTSYGIKDKNAFENRFWWHSAGYTPAGVEAWNGVRAVDYLLTRPDVDPEKIGVTGISGGGAATFWIAAADERIKVAVPVSGMSDLESYVKNKVVNGHCDCMFLYNTYQWDWTTIAALIAPRPLLFANSDNDPIFPMDGNRRIIAKLRKLYAMHEASGVVDEYVSVGGHAYRPDLRVAIFKFINKHLKKDEAAPVKDAEFAIIPGKDLRVFPTDDDTPKDAINARIDETFVPRAQVMLPKAGEFAAWKKSLMGQLSERVFRPLGTKGPVGKYEREKGVPYRPEVIAVGPHVKIAVLTVIGVPNRKRAQVLVLSGDDPQETTNVPAWGKPYWTDVYGGVMLYPRGLHHTWSGKSPPNTVERSHALLGMTVDQERVGDVVATVRGIDPHLKPQGVDSYRVVGRGASGIIAAYAALLEPSIEEVVVIDPPESHLKGPHFLNVLRVLDVPEALGLLAPRPLTIIGGDAKAFERTAEIYRLAGAADKLTRK